ncbi:coenzyme F420-0:L-glutamate ligase [Nocardioides cynanchi]|uniref:coenzyme F420-0:L-glutamate ligase n=1 Tax=Nocardioides cynanchi TaxID=2558918 RepID=UPI0012458F25|nr:coenzyme F420-0:L-glutamate ligase [Nocardioides cynanchi]
MITLWAPDGVGEVRRGDDLADLLLALVEPVDGDVVCVTSKVVSKAEGRVQAGDRADAVARETVRLVARRGPLAIVVNRLGLTMAAAGVDASNVKPGRIVLLPEDPDASARALRSAVAARTGVNVGVVVTDTAGRAWREGQTDIAIGAAGLTVVDDHAGRTDPYGNDLLVTAPAVADELAGAAELAAGKLRGRPFTLVRGRGDLVLPPGVDGPGAAGLLRPAGTDLFGLGSREAVLAALAGGAGHRLAFGSPADADELAGILTGLLGAGSEVVRDGEGLCVTAAEPRARWVAEVAAYAHGWRAGRSAGPTLVLAPAATEES